MNCVRVIFEQAMEFAISPREKTAWAKLNADDSYRTLVCGRIVMSHFSIFRGGGPGGNTRFAPWLRYLPAANFNSTKGS
jgi:hypothetical protein